MAANSSELDVVLVPLQELNQSEILLVGCKTPPPLLQNINNNNNNHLKNEEDNNQQQQQQQKQDLENSSNNHINNNDGFCKCKVVSAGTTPDRLKLPKPFNFTERYTSPTDHMMSPISKGILARKTRKGALLPPSIIQSKIQELQ